MICQFFWCFILVQFLLDDVAAFYTLLNDVRILQDLVNVLPGPAEICVCLQVFLLSGLGDLCVVQHNVYDGVECLVAHCLVLEFQDAHQVKLQEFHCLLGIVPEL